MLGSCSVGYAIGPAFNAEAVVASDGTLYVAGGNRIRIRIRNLVDQ